VLALDGVPGHHPDHEQVQNDAGALARVTGGSMGAIVPHRRPAPEGGGAAAPASLRVRCCARREGKLGGGYCSQFKGVAGELEGVEDATATKLGNGGGSGGAPAWSRRGTHGLWDGNLQPIELDEPLVNPKIRKIGAVEVVLHRRRRLHGGGGNPRRRRWWNWAQLRVLVCCGCKGRRRRSSTG
jgi:hypothetical protein